MARSRLPNGSSDPTLPPPPVTTPPAPPATPWIIGTDLNDVINLREPSSAAHVPANARAGAGNDFVMGNFNQNIIEGNDGNDTLVGGTGSSVLPGTDDTRIASGQDFIKGGAGVWGPVPMPANTQVREADAKKLAAWVLSTK